MNAAILQKETEIERAVLDVAQPGQDYRPLDLVELVVASRGNADWNQDLVLEAIWRLISGGKLMLSQERTLRIRP